MYPVCKLISTRWLMAFCFAGFLCSGLSAQNKKPDVTKPVSFRLAYQLLHSTHKNNFNGGSFDVDYHFSNRLATGIGIQYAATPVHPDNGWTLTHLHLLPVYASSIYTFRSNHVVQPYLHGEAGVSFNHYHKLDTTLSPAPFPVSEAGLYLSANGGVSFAVWQHTHLFFEVGYKGYNHSANALTVNPHGFVMRAGIEL